MTIDVLYFAWIKEKVGTGQEQVSPPESVVTVNDLIDWLTGQSASHASAFEDRDRVRAAVNQTHVSFETPIKDAQEVAFFPPVTGGGT
jgi:molybdopterin synthase sulfur carrier subunit